MTDIDNEPGGDDTCMGSGWNGVSRYMYGDTVQSMFTQ